MKLFLGGFTLHKQFDVAAEFASMMLNGYTTLILNEMLSRTFHLDANPIHFAFAIFRLPAPQAKTQTQTLTNSMVNCGNLRSGKDLKVESPDPTRLAGTDSLHILDFFPEGLKSTESPD